MIHVKNFTFNEFSVNSFVLYDDTNSCLLVDPGFNKTHQQQEFIHFIHKHELKPAYIVNTHGHVDHVAGNAFLKAEFGCPILMHDADMFLLNDALQFASIFGFVMEKPPLPDEYLSDNQILAFGNSTLKILHVPGHSPGSVCLYSPSDKFLIAGDVLFKSSIGRTDLPGGSYETLINGIAAKIMVLPRNTVVWPGHGPATTIGEEYDTNPFLKEYNR